MKKYPVSGVCSRAVSFEIENDIITKAEFEGGCHGNTQGVARLVEGMNVHEAIRRLKGIRCGYKDTSCPDQLARALEKAVAQA